MTTATCPLAAAGALIGPTSAGNWQRLLVRHSLRWVVAVIAAIHTDTRQPVNAGDAERVLDRLDRQRLITGTATIRLTDLARAILPARSTIPSLTSRPVSNAPSGATPAATEAHAPSLAAGPWLSHHELIRRTLVHMRLLNLTYDQTAEQIGISTAILRELICDRGRPSTNTRNRTIAWLDKQRSTWLTNVPA